MRRASDPDVPPDEKKKAADEALRVNAERLQYLTLQIEVQSRRSHL